MLIITLILCLSHSTKTWKQFSDWREKKLRLSFPSLSKGKNNSQRRTQVIAAQTVHQQLVLTAVEEQLRTRACIYVHVCMHARMKRASQTVSDVLAARLAVICV